MDGKRLEKKKELYRLAVARSDITSAMDSCGLLLGEVGHLTEDVYKAFQNKFYEPMLQAIIIAYARPFSRNSPCGRLEPKWAEFNDERLKKIHDIVLTMRDQAVAHSDLAERKVKVMPSGAPIGETGQKLGGLSLAISKNIYNVAFIREVAKLCKFVGGRIDQEVENLKEELYGSKSLPLEGYELAFEDDF